MFAVVGGGGSGGNQKGWNGPVHTGNLFRFSCSGKKLSNTSIAGPEKDINDWRADQALAWSVKLYTDAEIIVAEFPYRLL